MRDIAVICAAPQGINPGMDTVDHGLRQAARRHGFLDRLRFSRLYGCESESYEVVDDPEDFLERYRAIVFWGDFLHMRQYQLVVAQRLVAQGRYDDLGAALEWVQRLLLMKCQPQGVLDRTMSFGTTLFVNTIADDNEGDYGPALERFIRGARQTLFRDVFSALKACHIRRCYASDTLGVDGALLIDDGADHALEATSTTGSLGIWLGRTRHRDYVMSMVAFATELARRLDVATEWIIWGDVAAFPDLEVVHSTATVRDLSGFSSAVANDAVAARASLRRHRLIVTDTYHVCLNAWSQGIPAVCVAQNESSAVRDLRVPNYFARRDKRQIFMSMYDALDFFVGTNELVDARHRHARIAHLTKVIAAGSIADAIHTRIRQHAEAAERAFVDALSAICEMRSVRA